MYEGDLAETLCEIAKEFPLVRIGSYPKSNQEIFRVFLTFEGYELDQVQKASEKAQLLIPSKLIE